MIKKPAFLIMLLSLINLTQCTIVLINGTTCTGKSSTMREIMNQSKHYDLHTISTSIDDAFHVIASPTFTDAVKDVAQSLSDVKYNPVVLGYALWHEEIFRLQRKNPKATILVDHYFGGFEPQLFTNILHTWDGAFRPKLSFVKLFCTQQAAATRLIERNNNPDLLQHRDPGIASIRGHFSPSRLETLHGNKCYDLELDSTDMIPALCAQHIIAHLRTSESSTGFMKSFDINKSLVQDYWGSEHYNFLMSGLSKQMTTVCNKKDPADFWNIHMLHEQP
jgi:chloramphenicol 3-O-phosphotransferase